ncbi:hypothetical protein EIP91_006921 [Steccherinum ochraceum]|uniref:Uncharacterized protein n=1 Tax=Steccherinum ochraceum TaxID=92696 RepID=A0A4R0R4W6_9APHY|nr:hypothetical protein EIP91_006921 [Steccherinum ochraceum]
MKGVSFEGDDTQAGTGTVGRIEDCWRLPRAQGANSRLSSWTSKRIGPWQQSSGDVFSVLLHPTLSAQSPTADLSPAAVSETLSSTLSSVSRLGTYSMRRRTVKDWSSKRECRGFWTSGSHNKGTVLLFYSMKISLRGEDTPSLISNLLSYPFTETRLRDRQPPPPSTGFSTMVAFFARLASFLSSRARARTPASEKTQSTPSEKTPVSFTSISSVTLCAKITEPFENLSLPHLIHHSDPANTHGSLSVPKSITLSDEHLEQESESVAVAGIIPLLVSPSETTPPLTSTPTSATYDTPERSSASNTTPTSTASVAAQGSLTTLIGVSVAPPLEHGIPYASLEALLGGSISRHRPAGNYPDAPVLGMALTPVGQSTPGALGDSRRGECSYTIDSGL